MRKSFEPQPEFVGEDGGRLEAGWTAMVGRCQKNGPNFIDVFYYKIKINHYKLIL